MLTAYDGRTITYDTVGNPLSDGVRQYTWEHGRELATITKDGATWTNTYNQDGMRIRRTNGTVTYGYVYNGSQLSQMTVGSNTLNFSYDANGIPMSVSYNGTTYYYATNLQGDVTAILNASGSPVVSYTYDAWGKPLTVTGSLATTLGTHNPLRYRGYVYDTETELYYLQSRYYNPDTGRFLNADAFTSTGQGFTGNNMFAYCGNNPVNRSDPTGEAWWHWAIGAAIVAACAIATVVTAGGFAAAAGAVAMVGNGIAASTTATTVAASAFIGSATAYGTSVLMSASVARTPQEFSAQGNWGTVAVTAGGAVLGGGSAYISTRIPKTKIYRSVSNGEAQNIANTGQFQLSPGGMESKQFGFSLTETRQFGQMMGQNTIASAKIPTYMLSQYYTGGVATSIFRSGTLTVYGEQLKAFNQAIAGTIRLFR